MQKLRLTAVSYLNTKPLLYGILSSPLKDQVDISLNIPSECARQLRDGEADLGLVPVAILPELEGYHIISDFCIGTIGAVKTVGLYGHRPLEDWNEVILDYHSRTSVALTRLLFEKYWNRSPIYRKGKPGYIDDIGGNTGGLIIGDRAIGLEHKFPYSYDLGQVWMNYCDLPFVFAVWVSREPLSSQFIARFNTALANGVTAIPELNYLLPSPDPNFDLQEYFTKYISYELDAKKWEALHKFLAYLQQPTAALALAGS